MKLAFHNILNNFRFSPPWKWNFSRKHYVKNYPHRPYINFLIIMLQKYFRRYIIWGSTHCDHMCKSAEIFGQSKIYHFNACQIIFFIKHEIFWFDISVRYLSLMQILQCRKYLFHNICCNFFREILLVNNKLKKLSSITIFKHQKTYFIPLPYLIQLDNVWVIQCLQYFYFIHKCLKIFHTLFLNCFYCIFLLSFPVFS